MNITLYGKRKSGIKKIKKRKKNWNMWLRMPRLGDDPGWSRWVVNVIMSSHRRESNRETLLQIKKGTWLLAFKIQERLRSEKCILLKTGKVNVFLLELPYEIQPLNTLVPAQRKWFLTSDFQNDNRKKKKSLLFKDSNFLVFIITPTGKTTYSFAKLWILNNELILISKSNYKEGNIYSYQPCLL